MLDEVQPGAGQQEMEFGLLVVAGQERLQAGPSCWARAESAPTWLGRDVLGCVSRWQEQPHTTTCNPRVTIQHGSSLRQVNGCT